MNARYPSSGASRHLLPQGEKELLSSPSPLEGEGGSRRLTDEGAVGRTHFFQQWLQFLDIFILDSLKVAAAVRANLRQCKHRRNEAKACNDRSNVFPLHCRKGAGILFFSNVVLTEKSIQAELNDSEPVILSMGILLKLPRISYVFNNSPFQCKRQGRNERDRRNVGTRSCQSREP
jgi:hypothetical protein